jgi:predicted HAD superfamily phosphohydrolase YqeG
LALSHATETSETAIDSQIEQDLVLLKQNVQIPFLPKLRKKKYTLVLDLDETLIHLKE